MGSSVYNIGTSTYSHREVSQLQTTTVKPTNCTSQYKAVGRGLSSKAIMIYCQTCMRAAGTYKYPKILINPKHRLILSWPRYHRDASYAVEASTEINVQYSKLSKTTSSPSIHRRRAFIMAGPVQQKNFLFSFSPVCRTSSLVILPSTT